MFDFFLIAIPTLVVVLAIYGIARAAKMSLVDLVVIVVGIITSLIAGALLSIPLSRLPSPYGNILPITAALIVTVVTMYLFYSQREAIGHLFGHFGLPQRHRPGRGFGAEILVDTSVIIDGRIADIARAGFVPGRLLVPRFVLAELQNIADSDDSLRRSRGRRGLEMLNNTQETEGIDLEIISDDEPAIKEVDAKLVALARKRSASILTTDYNLNRVAQIQGVKVLNINELSNAIRPVVLPGEEMMVKIVQAGKERNQGVGYLPDGTMIVVENGDRMIGQEVQAEVTRVFQTVAGKMIFASPKKTTTPGNSANERRRNHSRRHHPKDQSASGIEERLVQQNSTDL